MGVVVDPCSDGVAALEVDAVQDGVSGYEGLHGVHVEAHVVLGRVVAYCLGEAGHDPGKCVRPELIERGG